MQIQAKHSNLQEHLTIRPQKTPWFHEHKYEETRNTILAQSKMLVDTQLEMIE